MRKKNKSKVVWIFVIAIAFIALFYLANGGFSVLSDVLIGEEGFEPYDPLLKSGGYSPDLWEVNTPLDLRRTFSGDNYVEFKGGDGEFKYPEANCVRYGVGSQQYNCQSPAFKTQNLYLKDFKATVSGHGAVSSDHSGTNINIGHNVVFGADSVWTGRCPNCWPRPIEHSVELRWDDYETGHYQVFMDDKLVDDGFATDSFYFSWAMEWQRYMLDDRSVSKIRFENPRVKDLFGCDNEEGMLIVDACYGGVSAIQREDLDGWVDGESKFCLELPAQHIVDGVTSSSQRVYYALASGEPVVIEAKEAWKFSYMTPDETVGNKTGFGYGCGEKVLVDDNVDIEQQSEMIGNRKGYWLADITDRALYSGGERIFLSGYPRYSCQETDGHDPSGDRILYPAPQASCWDVTLEGTSEFFEVGDSIDLNDYFTLELHEMRAAYEYDTDRSYLRDSWQLLYIVELIKNPITINEIVVDGEDLVVTFDNGLAGDYAVLARYSPQNINQKTQEVVQKSFGAGEQTVRVPRLVSEGLISADVVFTLQTEIGNFQASDNAGFAYEGVVTPDEPPVVIDDDDIVIDDDTDVPIDDVPVKQSWYVRFWNWLKGIFT